MGMNDLDFQDQDEENKEQMSLPAVQKGRKADEYRSAECLNCNHPLELSDRYCAYCGQLNTTKQLSLNDFFGEFLSTIFTYDSRLRYTLRDLLFKPGTITKNYVGGKFLKYANPFRFFLSVSIIYFLIQGLISAFNDGNNSLISTNSKGDDELKIVADSTDNNFKLVNISDEGVQEKVAEEMSKHVDSSTTAIVTQALKNADSTQQARQRIKDSIGYVYKSEAELDTLDWAERTVERGVLYYNFYNTTEIKDPKRALDSLKHRNNRTNKWLYSKSDAINRIKDNPAEFANYLLGKVPFFMFFFAPIFALGFWLIYSKKKFTYMEHLVFIFHIFSFVFLALLIALIPDLLLGNDIVGGILMTFIGPFYFYKALRNFYKQSRLITILKFVFLNWFFWIGTTVAAILFFSITAAIY